MTIRHDLTVRQGETWSHVYTHRDSAGSAIDLTGYSARMAVKRAATDAETPQAYLSTGSDADGGTITLGGAAGTVTLAMTAAETSGLLSDVDITALIPPAKRSLYADKMEEFVYDLEIIDGSGSVTRALEGRFLVRRGVTE